MRSQWEALQQSLVRSVGTLGAESLFQKMKEDQPHLRRFPDAGNLLAYFNHVGGDLDEKDAIYAALVAAVQAGGEDAELAAALVWLGLWPALDRIYRRRLKHYLDTREPEALVSEIGAKFSAVLHKADLSQINRVAATLVRNTERDVLGELKRGWVEGKLRADLPREEDDDPDEDEAAGDFQRAQGSPLLRTRGVSRLGQPFLFNPDDEIEALREMLADIVGEDADLVIGATLYGFTQREIGERLGLSHEAARKRYQRAMAQLREHLDVD